MIKNISKIIFSFIYIIEKFLNFLFKRSVIIYLSEFIQNISNNKIIVENKKVSFLVCSDEKIPDYISNLSNIYLTDGKEISDLYALSKCDYLIGVSSTFSGWASFHGEVPLYNLKPNIDEIDLSSFKIVQF